MITLGLQRITQLLNPLFNAHPYLPWRAVHIAGTNGKGSVAALISTFLGHLDYNVGRFTSPHLIDRWDCITINRKVVDRDKFLSIEQHFRDRSVEENIGASEFEILTATAFQLFTNEKVDVAVVECGLGGREDATNVLRPRDVILSVLTKVGLDHTEFLGDTIEAITTEKAGIFKPGVPVVLDQSNERVVIEAAGKRMKELGWENDGRDGVYFSREEQRREFQAIWVLASAKHQIQNLYTAYSAFRHAEMSLSILHADRRPQPKTEPPSFDVVPPPAPPSLQYIHLSLQIAQSSLPGRLQWLTLPSKLVPSNLREFVDRQPRPGFNPLAHAKILLDGAHNAQSAEALAGFVDRKLRSDAESSEPITWLLSVKNDKDVDEILSLLLKPSDHVVTSSFGPVDGMPWVKAMSASDLAVKARKLTKGIVEDSPCFRIEDPHADADSTLRDEVNGLSDAQRMIGAIQDAVRMAYLQDERNPRLCITGSLYLVGDVLRCVRNAGGSINTSEDAYAS